MSCGIYKITNQINGHSYIGQSIYIEGRWSDEKNDAFNKNSESYNTILSQAFRKYGIENFNFEILEECDPSELDLKEIYYISLYNTYFSGYNMTTGGQGAPNSCSKISKEQLLEIYDLLLNSTIPQNDIAKEYNVGYDVISNINQGKSRRLNNYSYPLRAIKKRNFCIDCGKKLSDAKSYRCVKCQGIQARKVERPTKEELYNILINNKGNFSKVGSLFGVQDNTIRKWCKAYDIPFHSSDYITRKVKQPVELPKKVTQIDIVTDQELNYFNSLNEAGRFIISQNISTDNFKSIASHISQVCNGKRKTAYGYKWKFII